MINSDFFISQYWRLNYNGNPGESPLSRDIWARFIESRQDFSWNENPALFSRKTAAQADFDKKKGFHKFGIFYRNLGFRIDIDFNEMRPNRARLLLCLDLAEELGAHLFRISAKKPVTREWIELKYPEKKKPV